MYEVEEAQKYLKPNIETQIQMAIVQNRNTDPRRYNIQRCNEVAMVFLGKDGETLIDRDLLVHIWQEDTLIPKTRRIDYGHRNPDALSYPLLFLYDSKEGIPVGKRVILPSKFSGSPRNMQQKYQDAMGIVMKYGKPDLFITTTFIPNNAEISENIDANEKRENTPDLVDRVFRQKLKALMTDIRKNIIFGKVNVYCYSALLEKIVSAEISDKNTHPRLFSIITKNMIHGTCVFSSYSSCIVENICSKSFLKKFQEYTVLKSDGYPLYHRRKNDPVKIRKNHVDNSWDVPYKFCESCLNYALNYIIKVLNTHGKRCRDFGLEDSPTNLIPPCATFDEQENFNYKETYNEDQRIAFAQIMTALNNSNNEKVIIFKRTKRTIISVASTRIAADLLHKGRTYHSRFKVPLILNETSVCGVKPNSSEGREIHDSSLITWDEATPAPAFALQSKDRLLKDIQCKSRLSFDGKVIKLGRDYRQYFVHASIKYFSLWNDFKILKLRNNIRAKDKRYSEWQITLGNRQLMNTDGLEKTLIEISSHMISKDKVKDIFGEILFVNTVCKFSKKVILKHTNEAVNKINQSVLDILQGEEKTYLSTDSLISDDTGDVTDYSFKLIVCEMKPNLIVAKLLTDLGKEDYIFLSRIDLTSDAGLLFQLKRRQLPIRLAFAMTINKAQGKKLDKVGIFLPTPAFGDGQLYVAFPRVRSSNDVKVYIKDTAEQGKILLVSDKIFTKNVVCKAVLDNCVYISYKRYFFSNEKF
ncbi:PIF1-like helicase [Hamiltosporidium magnivora]|uniref:ATP-dependent DNA helicase n=1 Tax=Hamiltosporidium magnivora TaxID=148818 RepID=A0A4Q9L9P2_9MICR|nr:PIF1-like helicase [Hamiltosporidium magnivora]